MAVVWGWYVFCPSVDVGAVGGASSIADEGAAVEGSRASCVESSTAMVAVQS